MNRHINISTRELTPFEQLVMVLVCDGKSNSAIAAQTTHKVKAIENVVSRSAQAFGIRSNCNTNLRVMLSLAFRKHYGDASIKKLEAACSHFELGPDGKTTCLLPHAA